MTIDNGVRQRRQFTTNVRNPADNNGSNKQRTPGDDDPYYKRDIHLEFKPLIEVDPTIKLSQNRTPLSIPRPGDYTLSKTASTEGIASKKSLELKKKYLLGESTAGTGVLKSGSASALDSKFKSFHSNITECQKLLNPAPEISPTMQTFLQKTSAPAPTTPAPATSLLTLRKEAMLTGGIGGNKNEEKENVYDGKFAPSKRYAETVNATLVENKLNELKKEEAATKDKKTDDRPNNNNERLIETINLITPEKPERKSVDDQQEQVEQKPEDGDRIVEIKNISNLKHMFIDLTSDSPNCDRSLVETTLNFSMTPPSAAKGSTVQTNGELKNSVPDIISSSIKIDSNENKVEEEVEEEQERTRSPAHETSIQVPEVPWSKEQDEEEEDIDSDSISEASSSSSSTSSVDDIPHFILDSTTSPETQNDERFVPRVEVRDTAGELMQIDSLMIIDGKYIGDPEDLKLLEELPPDTKIAAKLSQQEMNLDSICVLQSREEKVLEEQEEPPQEEPKIPLPVLELEPKEEPVEQPTSKPSSPTQPKPDLKFDTRNENKLDTLKNLPLVLDLQPSNQQPPQKPRNLSFAANRKSPETDAEKTPLAPSQLLPQLAKAEGSDSETELTAQNLTETELSDWAADDAVSENFVDIEFALSGSNNKGTIKRNKPKHGRLQQKKVIAAASPIAPAAPPPVEVKQQASEDGIIKNLAIEDIEFMDTGSEEESCIESYSATNRTMLKNRGYVEFVDPSSKPVSYSYGQQQVQQQQPSSKPKLVEAINKQVAGVDYIEQGAYLLNNVTQDDSKTPMNEEPPTKITFSALAAQNKALQQQVPQQLDSLNDIEEDSLLIVTSSQGTATTTEESEAPTIVAPPVERTAGSGSSGRGSVSSFSSKQLEGDKSMGGSPVRKVSTESSSGGKRSSLERNMRKDSLKNNIDDIGYDEYVKRLQQKIAQISSARDSLEVKKSKRKSSKGDAGLDEASVAEPVKKPTVASIYTEQSSLEVPKSVEKKIEEITKERVKQKDIIHDLVMDKLQTKKQLNAEKRLNRSRNRNNVLPGVSPVTPSHPTASHPPEPFPSYQPVSSDRRNRILDTKETTFAQPTPVPIFPNKENIASFNTPSTYLPTPRSKKPPEETLTLTEQLREEARARARLKSNQDLGLSPEDRVQLLRKKFHINLRELNDQPDQQPNKCDDTKFKERSKLMTSKSVNDVSILKNLSNDPDFISPVDDGRAAVGLVGAKLQDYVSDPNLVQSPTTNSSGVTSDEIRLRTRSKCKDRERRKSIIEKVSEFFNSRKKTEPAAGGGSGSGSKDSSPTKKEGAGSGSEHQLAVGSSGNQSSSNSGGGVGFLRFKISPKLKDKSKSCFDVRNMGFGTKEGSPYERCASEDCLKNTPATGSSSGTTTATGTTTSTTTTSGRDTTTTSSPPGGGTSSGNRFTPIGRKEAEELEPPPIPPLPLNYQRSDDESCTTNEPKNELKKLRAMSKASRQAELKRLRIAQEIQREQEEIEVKIKDLETRGVEIEKELRGESESLEKNIENLGANDEGLVKEWLELMRSITRLKVRDEELTIRQQELQLEHRHAQLKEELNMRLSCSKLDKNSSDVAAEGAILNEMLEIVAKRQALRPSLDAAAAAAAASVGAALPPPTTVTTRSKDVSDI